MSRLNVKIIAPVVVAVAAVGYFGLSSYAGGKAEKKLEDFLYENRLESYFSWKSVSSSPFGGTVTIKDITIESRELFPVELSVDKFVIKNFNDDKEHMSADLSLKNVRPTDPDSDFAKGYNRNVFGFLLAASGQTAVEPYDVNVSWNYNERDRTLKTQLAIDLPNLFATHMQLDLEGVRDLKNMLLITQVHPALGVLPSIPAQFLGMDRRDAYRQLEDLKNITINGLDMSFKDQGYLQRANLLEQRYNITPTKVDGNIEKERKQLFNEQYEHINDKCIKEYDSGYKNAKKACTAVIGTLFSKEKGFKVSVKPDSKVKLQDFERLDGNKRERNRFIERLNLNVTTY